jgi:rhamnulose-1-phosphate aldolase/alcohol dehydrogenase
VGVSTAGSTVAPWAADDGLGALALLAYRSNLLARQRSIVNEGGGNTSAKSTELDHTGREHEVLWIKGSGKDLASIRPEEFTGLRLEEVLPLRARETMDDEEMVVYLARCQLDPGMPRPSIETLLHAFISQPHVDHTHPDSIGAIVGAVDGRDRAAECFGDTAVWIDYIRPGFALAKLVAESIEEHPDSECVLLAKHGLVTWGESAEACYHATIEAVARAGEFVADRAASKKPTSAVLPAQERDRVLAGLLPELRGAVTDAFPRVLLADTSPAAVDFVSRPDAEVLSQVGAACPDHLVHTKRRPLWVAFGDDASLAKRVVEGVAAFRASEAAYQGEDAGADADTSPRIALVERVGIVAIGHTHRQARLARDLYRRAIQVMTGAAALGGFVSLTDEEAHAVEFWPLELYKLSLSPARKPLDGKIVLITGGAGGIGRAIARRVAADGACVVVADIDESSAQEVADTLGPEGCAVAMDVTDEESVQSAFDEAVRAFGGVDVVVSNAGIASSAPIEETTLALWERNYDVLVRGYFLVLRAASRVLRRQAQGGSIVVIGSKNGLAASRAASAYSSAKAAEIHLARCLAEELGPDSIRVNVVNPDAVISGSRIWDSEWREQRARGHGIDPSELEQFYRSRTTLGVEITPEDVAEAVCFFADSARSGKSTGNIINVDGGVPTAYPR